MRERKAERTASDVSWKQCARCGRSEPIGEFYLLKTGGRGNWCRLCRNEYDRQWHAKNREEVNAKNRQRYAENPEKFREYSRRKHAKKLETLAKAGELAEYREKEREASRRRYADKLEALEKDPVKLAEFREKLRESNRQRYAENKAKERIGKL